MDELGAQTAPALPFDVLVKVLQYVKHKKRLKTCSMVNRTWHRAVKSTFKWLTCKLGTDIQSLSLSQWLNSSHDSHLQSLTVHSKLRQTFRVKACLPTLQLPFQQLGKLQTLKVMRFSLKPAVWKDFTSSEGYEAAIIPTLASLTALTELKLEWCAVDLSGLGSCTNLRHLQLCLAQETRTVASSLTQEAVLAAALPHLQHLTLLSLDSNTVTGDAKYLRFDLFSSALITLQQLSTLELGCCVIMPQYTLAHLPVSLHILKVKGSAPESLSLSSEVCPHLQQLTHLQQLHFSCVHILEPKVLLSCPQLTYLHLYAADTADDDTVMQFLAAIKVLQQLKHLDLPLSLRYEVLQSEPYAALTASGHLTYLDLSHCRIPPEAARYMFAPGQPCSGLVELCTIYELMTLPGSFDLLVSTCPALQALRVIQPSCDHIDGVGGNTDLQGLSALQNLTTLTRLTFWGTKLSDSAMQSIAKCQRLRSLNLFVTVTTPASLTRLTQLSELTHLAINAHDEARPFLNPALLTLEAKNKAAARCPPDVQHQLVNHLKQQQWWIEMLLSGSVPS